MVKYFADTHGHSRLSDGSLGIIEYYEKIIQAHERGLWVAGLTDHDLFSSEIDQIRKTLEVSNEFKGVFLPGVEITTRDEDQILHLITYAPDQTHPAFYRNMQNALQENRHGKKALWEYFFEKLKDIQIVKDKDQLVFRIKDKKDLEAHLFEDAAKVGLKQKDLRKPLEFNLSLRSISKYQSHHNIRRPVEIADMAGVLANAIFKYIPEENKPLAYEWVLKTFFTRGTALNTLLKLKYPSDVPGYDGKYMTTKNAIKLANRAQGVPILAHPGAYGALNHVKDRIGEYVKAGLWGMETIYPAHSAEVQQELEEMAFLHGILKMGGSDFHGNRPQEVLPPNLQEKLRRRYATLGEIIRPGENFITRVPLEYLVKLFDKIEDVYGAKHPFLAKQAEGIALIRHMTNPYN